MTADAALAELMAVSPQLLRVVILRGDAAEASSVDGVSADGFATAAQAIVVALDDAAPGRSRSSTAGLLQAEVATDAGSVFVVRSGSRAVVGCTRPSPTVGLVFYDMKACLRSIEAGGGDA